MYIYKHILIGGERKKETIPIIPDIHFMGGES